MSAYQNYTVFYPWVTPFFPGVPDLIILDAIRNACIEFCDRTDWLFYTPVAQQVTANENEYDLTLDLPIDTTIARVQSVWVNGITITPKDEEDLRRMYNLDWRSQTGNPAYFTQYEPETLILVPIPTLTVAQGLATTLVLRPARTSATVDGDLFEYWLETVAAGARARLHEIPGQQYENPQLADKMKAVFDAGIARAIAQRQRGLVRSTPRIRPPLLV